MCKPEFNIQKRTLTKLKLFFIFCLVILLTVSVRAQLPGQLPVNLKAFKAALVSPAKVKVFWTTEYEKNNAFFNIERSANGTSFSSVGKVAGVNQNGVLTDYIFYDNNPLTGVSFYRLKQVDIDSNFNYSPIARVKNTGAENTTVDVFPNPATVGFFKIDLFKTAPGNIDVQVYDMAGRLQLQQQFNSNNIIIPHHLPAGMYVVKISGKAFTATKKLLVQ
jgi:trimeric autotransporter adhesin